MEVKIPNRHILGFASWLNELQLPAIDSRQRSRFVQKLRSELVLIEGAKKDTAKKYANLDEKGEPVVINNHWDIPDDKIASFSNEINALLDDSTTIVLTKDEYDSIKRTVLNTRYVFGPRQEDSAEEKQAKIRQADDYVVWCDLFGTK